MAEESYRAQMDSGRRYLQGIDQGETIVLVFHGDADGCSSGAIMYRALLHLGHDLVFPVFIGKGENLYSDSLHRMIMARQPSRLIVMDTGSRGRPIIEGLSTMVIDHHQPDGAPPVDVYINSHDVEPVAPSSLVTYQLCRELVPIGGFEWLAAIGTAADLGIDCGFETVSTVCDLFGTKVLKEAVALVNAARRAPAHDIARAFDALIKAEKPSDISEGIVPETAFLARYRDEANAEFRRVIRTAPRHSGQWAVLQFSSPALVHPLVAISWVRRLKNDIVVAANYGYTEGKVHFSVRSARDIDLLAELARFRPEGADLEFAHGHPRATGGIVPVEVFREFLRRLGFSDDIVNAEPSATTAPGIRGTE